MFIAIAQVSPAVPADKTGFLANVARADAVIGSLERQLEGRQLDLLILPEMAFTGYNFPSLAAITPYLEPTASGPTTEWAQATATRLGCTVCVGYPERGPMNKAEEEAEATNMTEQGEKAGQTEGRGYNSLVCVDAKGVVRVNYRKSFLYETDDSWALEGGGFGSAALPLGSSGRIAVRESGGTEAETEQTISTALGICMDLSPYKFTAPFDAFEFGHHVVNSGARLVVVSMAWLSSLSKNELIDPVTRAQPDTSTLKYWLLRLLPVLRRAALESLPAPLDEEADTRNNNNNNNNGDHTTILVFSNRAGIEPDLKPASSETETQTKETLYAGTSSIVGIRPDRDSGQPHILVWSCIGRAVEGFALADTERDEPVMEMVVGRALLQGSDAGSDESDESEAENT